MKIKFLFKFRLKYFYNIVYSEQKLKMIFKKGEETKKKMFNSFKYNIVSLITSNSKCMIIYYLFKVLHTSHQSEKF